MFRGNLGGYGILPYPRSLKGSSHLQPQRQLASAASKAARICSLKGSSHPQPQRQLACV